MRRSNPGGDASAGEDRASSSWPGRSRGPTAGPAGSSRSRITAEQAEDAGAVLLRLLRAEGSRIERLVFTRNRRVMLSVTAGGRELRIHETFRRAAPETLRAIAEVVAGRSSRDRIRARRQVQAYIVTAVSAAPAAPRPRRPPRIPDGDRPYLERLRLEFERVNESHFSGALPSVPIRLSGRMRRRNGHFSADPLEIAISRTLCVAAADGEAERTLRHEMIHLWQWATGARVGHGADFRRWARRLEIHPRASRSVCWTG